MNKKSPAPYHKYIAVDTYGNLVYIRRFPRKELMEHHGVKGADKMYTDTKSGVWHIGYVVARHWYTVYGVEGIRFFKKV